MAGNPFQFHQKFQLSISNWMLEHTEEHGVRLDFILGHFDDYAWRTLPPHAALDRDSCKSHR